MNNETFGTKPGVIPKPVVVVNQKANPFDNKRIAKLMEDSEEFERMRKQQGLSSNLLLDYLEKM